MAVLLALPGMARAGDSDEASEDKTTTTTTPESTSTTHQVNEVVQTLPVLGSGLGVTITRDPETGAITVVGLDDATIVKEKDHKIVFLLGDGETEVVVKAKAGFVQTKVKAKATADVTGPGSWSADVFGNGVVTIPYNVTFDGNTPNIAIGDITAPSGVTADVGDPKLKASEDGDKAYFKVKVRLTSGEETAKVSFVAKVRVDDDGELKVALSVSLSSHDRVKCWDGDDERDDRDHDRWRDGDDDGDRDGRWRDRDRDDDDRDGDRDGDWDDDHDSDRDSDGGDGGGGDN
jgi:hypothetical protein